ncbi:hypothetical protein [Pedobacter caeni]|uniref:Cytochrome c domain-containing protein n=1 Tax=Pedobacter caeni TaxID=288992 RepID=A0A1M5JN16_9SPHI|nr:hypothetical protein [Pedobacter caeni]SHG41976.1 hypothetical protein SAMN04488522_105438 [Pedobacter caeni]
MDLNTIRLSLISLMIFLMFACTSNNKEQQKGLKEKTDPCRLYLYEGNTILSEIGCRNCHLRAGTQRLAPNIPLFKELSAMDSLKLKDYIFKSKHNGMYSNELKSSGEKLDSLTECQIRNLTHYIKNFNRNIPKN